MADGTARRWLRNGWDIGRAVLTTSSGRSVADAVAESAFYIALAVLPMMLTTTALLRAIRPLLGRDARPAVEHGLARMLRIVLTAKGSTAADAAGDLLSGTTSGLLTLGTLGSLLLVGRAMRSLLAGVAAAARRERTIATAYHREWGVALAAAALGVAITAVILAMVAIGPLLGHTHEVATSADHAVRVVWIVLRWPVGLLAVFVFVLLVHRVGLRGQPRCGGRRAALLGAGVATAGAVLASLLLPLYVHIAASVSPTLGVLGGGLILLVWSYLLALSVLIGAQVRTLLEHRITNPPAGFASTPGVRAVPATDPAGPSVRRRSSA